MKDCNCTAGKTTTEITQHAETCDYRREWEVTKDKAIMLNPTESMCSLHLEPFRAKWPSGWQIFMISTFQMLTAKDGIWDEARKLAGVAEGEDINPKVLEQVFKVKPMCCRLTSKELYERYVVSKVGVVARCKVCGKKQIGTPYETTQQKFSHLCFKCVSVASSTPYRN